MSKIQIKRSRGIYGEIVRHVDRCGKSRLYIKRVRAVGIGTSWVVSDATILTLDSMVCLNKQYHFHTQAEIIDALQQEEQC